MEEEPTQMEEWARPPAPSPHVNHVTAPCLSHSSHSMRVRRVQFNSKAFAGASNTTEKRWEHLNIRVDTVDRFQGAESPIVIVSMVRSAPIDDGPGQEIEEAA